ncbi:MAG: ABC-2 transporter permease [Nevskia sp.]|jgi:hypothetical protein|nr:ABC-2 transporter permease [Nevskia sp.]
MTGLRRFGAILRADLLERSRATRFWVVIVLIAAGVWWCFPPANAPYLAVAINVNHRGLYSSAWIGMVVGLMYSTLLSLLGFYVVRGTLTRDIETRVWQLLVTTPMTRAGYLFAKWCSHLIVLGIIVSVGLVVALAAQWVRAEDRHIDLVELIKPTLVLALPALAICSVFAVWFDLVPWLRRTAGNILYFFVWVALLTVPVVQSTLHNGTMTGGALRDPAGIVTFSRSIQRAALPELGGEPINNFNILGPLVKETVVPFAWPRWALEFGDLRASLIWLAFAAIGVIIAAPFLERAAAHTAQPAAQTQARSGRRLRWLTRVLAPLQRNAFGTLYAAELQFVLRQRAGWWWLALLASCGVQIFAPPSAVSIAVIAAWMLSLDSYAHAALRERDSGTAAFVYTATGATGRILRARGLALLTLAWLPTLPAVLRYAATAPAAAFAVLVIGASIASWGYALGALTRNARTFELLAVALAYFSIQGLPVLNISAAPISTALWHLALLPVAITLALLALPQLRGRA